MVVAAVAFVDLGAAGFDLGNAVQFGNYGLRVWRAVQRLGVQHKLAALGLGGRGRQSRVNLGA